MMEGDGDAPPIHVLEVPMTTCLAREKEAVSLERDDKPAHGKGTEPTVIDRRHRVTATSGSS